MEKLWRFDGSFVDKYQTGIWRNCGKLTHWKITDQEKPKTRYNGVVREPNGRTEHATEDYRLGKNRQRQGGFDWSFLGNCRNNRGKTVLLFGVPSDWIPCEHMEHFQVGKIRAD